MADISPAVSAVGRGDNSTMRVTWSPVTNADTCHPVSFPEYSDRSIHVFGIFGGATVQVLGSNNGGVSFATLNDPTETTISLTSERIRAILENTEFIQPIVSGGDGTQAVGVSILFHLTNPLRH